MGAEVNWNLVRRAKSLAKFDIKTNLDTAHVACLRIFPGIKPESEYSSFLCAHTLEHTPCAFSTMHIIKLETPSPG